MITKQEFFNVISAHLKFNEAVERMEESFCGKKYTVNLHESDWVEAENKIFKTFLESYFTEEALDDIYWWLYEDVDKVFYVPIEGDLFNEKTEEVVPVRTLGQLWSFFERNPETYFKNV